MRNLLALGETKFAKFDDFFFVFINCSKVLKTNILWLETPHLSKNVQDQT